MELRRRGAVEDRVFAETRLRRGVYGQRYDNGQRHDGLASQRLEFPAGELTKGPETLWDAPGMVRIKVPYGGITPDQLDLIAELAEEYSDAILHITTRQDVQLHYVHIDDTPTLMRRLASVDITTREACGNGVRNLTACPLAGVCHTEAFDTTPYAAALFRFLLGHPDCQDFGRKFKPAFSGCAGEACGLVMMHDFGAIARSSVVRRRRAARVRHLRRRRPGHDAPPGQARSTRTTRSRSCCPRPRRSPASSAASARSRTATARASSSSSPSSASTSSAAWSTRSGRSSPTTTAGPPTCRTSTTSPSRPSARPSRSRATARATPPATPSGRAPTSTASASRATPWPRSRCPWATSAPSRRASSPTWPAATWATRCARRWSRTSCCAGSPRATCRRSTPTWRRSTSPPRAPGRSWTSPPAPAPTPASSASRRRAGSPASCAPAWARASSSSTRPCAACASRSAAASTRAASTTSPTSASSATAARSTA